MQNTEEEPSDMPRKGTRKTTATQAVRASRKRLNTALARSVVAEKHVALKREGPSTARDAGDLPGSVGDKPPMSFTGPLEQPVSSTPPAAPERRATKRIKIVKKENHGTNGKTRPRTHARRPGPDKPTESRLSKDEHPKQIESPATADWVVRHTTASTTTAPTLVADVEEHTARDVLHSIVHRLETFPTGEVACGTELVDIHLPNIEITGVGVISPPFDKGQLKGLKAFAKELRAKAFGIDWQEIQRTPTWTIPGSGIKIDDRGWDKLLDRLAGTAGEYLGFGTAKFTPRLHGLYLWEKGSVWRDYHNQYHDPIRVGSLLIILNRDYKGGEVAVGFGDKEMFFDPAPFFLRNLHLNGHNGVSYDNLPLTQGYRLALSYDLRLETHNGRTFVKVLTRMIKQAEEELRSYISTWAEQIEAGERENRPLLFVLGHDYEPRGMSIRYLSAEDRAKALALQVVQRESYDCGSAGYRLQVYLVAVTATSKNYGSSAVASRVKYAIERAATLDGVLMNRVRDTIVDERCVLQPAEFENGTVSRQVLSGMNTTTRTRTCLMLVLEKAKHERDNTGAAITTI
ncbi:hypothetical protein VTK56DRAFT_6416 [Thermocarpiscus australiensis]